jgi:regulator of replication initiation timing
MISNNKDLYRAIWAMWSFYIARAENPTYEETVEANEDIAILLHTTESVVAKVVQDNISLKLEIDDLSEQIRDVMHADRQSLNAMKTIDELKQKRDELQKELL